MRYAQSCLSANVSVHLFCTEMGKGKYIMEREKLSPSPFSPLS